MVGFYRGVDVPGVTMIRPEEHAANLTPLGGPIPKNLEELYAFREKIADAIRQHTEEALNLRYFCMKCNAPLEVRKP